VGFEASNLTQEPLQPSCTHSRLKPHPLSNELATVTALGQWQWWIQDFETGGSVSFPRSRRQCIEVCSGDPSTRSAEKFFHLHFSLIRMGSCGTFVLCTASFRCS